jgi:hypothetical protein
VATCPLCANDVPPGLKRCPLCQTDVTLDKPASVNPGKPASEAVYDLSATDAEIPPNWQAAAVYTLDIPARCPHCREPIRTVRVQRMTRTQVSFTSTLPRGGRVIACPQCERILSIELATFG